ncbi:hypothetical protein VNO78_11475 [Psophocarpus tetragonolobus]|uniref:Uncharacterized protein n=1 Tax=Psophocarpus tetragonolobus TaxID=3891 RepID=A0AAN9XNH0_PSOTE
MNGNYVITRASGEHTLLWKNIYSTAKICASRLMDLFSAVRRCRSGRRPCHRLRLPPATLAPPATPPSEPPRAPTCVDKLHLSSPSRLLQPRVAARLAPSSAVLTGVRLAVISSPWIWSQIFHRASSSVFSLL